MIKIDFYPDSDLKDFSQAVLEYKTIWEEDGERIVSTWEKKTGCVFKETFINAIVFHLVSLSHALSLRHDIPYERKKSTLVHELGHRLLNRYVRDRDLKGRHQFLFLVLYDVLTELYGVDFTKATIEFDSLGHSPIYKDSWDWVLQFSPEERSQKFKEILEEGRTILTQVL